MDGPADVDAVTLTELVARALDRDDEAWAEIVHRLERVVWKAVNLVTFDEQIRRDAFAATWMRLVERLATVREPEKLPGWLAVTATREAIRLSRSEARFVLEATEDVERRSSPSREAAPESVVERRDAVAVVRRALAELGEPCRELLTLLLVQDPPATYAEIAEQLGRTHGWIGPTKERCLDKLRARSAVAALAREEGA